MKLNFPLDELEKYINDDMLEAADALDTQYAMKGLREVDKNLWSGRFDEGESVIETEVLIQGARVKNVTCECATFQDNAICGHVVMTMIAVRRRRQMIREGKQQAKERLQAEKEQNQRFTLSHILKKIDPPQLFEFVTQYARTDKQFALAIKARFATDMVTGDFTDHIKTLIDNTLKSVKNPKGKITPKGWLQIFTMLDELRQKADANFKNGELSKSFDIIKISLPLLHRLMRMADAPKSKLEKRQLHTIVLLRGYGEVLLSPELSEQLWVFVKDEFAFNARFTFADSLFDWLMSHSTDNVAKTDRLLDILDNALEHQRPTQEERDRLLTYKIQILQKIGRVEEAGKLIIASADKPDVFQFAVQNALNHNDLALAKNLCLNGLILFQQYSDMPNVLASFLLEIAIKENNRVDMRHYAEELFLRNLDMKYYSILKEIGISKEHINKIIEIIDNQPYRIEKRDALSALFFEEKQWDKLFAFISDLKSLELLRRYGVALWQEDADQSLALHKTVLYEYLYAHLGRPPALRVRGVLESHWQNDGQTLTELLIADIKKDFPERYSLIEELNLMLEEQQKRAVLG